jgi:hypothetical protein
MLSKKKSIYCGKAQSKAVPVHAKKACARVETQYLSFLISALGGVRWVSHSSSFVPGETATFTHWTGGWVDSRACLDTSE